MNQDIENIIKKNLPEKKKVIANMLQDDELYNEKGMDGVKGFNQALSQIDTSLIADEVLKITKCNCCDEEDEHIFKDDRSTTRISRPCSGCGKHQTIAGALLKSKEWEKWYKYASENMLFDVDETLTVDAMSDEHWNSFMKFLADEVLKVVVEKIEEEIKKEYSKDEYCYQTCIVDILQLLSNLSTNKENKNNERNV
jgi:hypothetical protein